MVDHALLHPVEQRLRVLAVGSPHFAGPQILSADDISSFGGDALLTPSADKLRFSALFSSAVQPYSERERLYDQIYDQLKRTISQLQVRVVELDAANKELETFNYSASHDLRAPLRHIDGFSKILLEDYSERLDAEGRGYLQQISEASEHMAQLIDGLLNLSRATRGEIRRDQVSLSALAREISEGLKRSQPEREVEFVVAEGVIVTGDARLLRAVLENLLGNAWKFTGKHPTAGIEFGVTHQNGETVYFVRDDGAGFAMAYADKVFAPFQRQHSDAEFPGAGIGLSTVQRIIRRHGGRVWASGVEEQGATFYFTLPLQL